jgi:DNA-binding LytR/AlgR family response regulator
MIRVIAVDDESLALDIIEMYCKSVEFLSYDRGFTRTSDALQYLGSNQVDLLLLDINMPSISGIDFFRSLQHKPMLIFTTSYSEYALESYDLGAVDYLLKPFTLERFEKAVQRVNEVYTLMRHASVAEKAKFLMLKAEYGVIKVALANILFIEGLDNYLKIHLEGQSPVVIRMTMKSLMEKLNEKEFLRVHRSYIIAVNRVESIKQKIITISGEEIPVGKNYEESLKALLNKYS